MSLALPAPIYVHENCRQLLEAYGLQNHQDYRYECINHRLVREQILKPGYEKMENQCQVDGDQECVGDQLDDEPNCDFFRKDFRCSFHLKFSLWENSYLLSSSGHGQEDAYSAGSTKPTTTQFRHRLPEPPQICQLFLSKEYQ